MTFTMPVLVVIFKGYIIADKIRQPSYANLLSKYAVRYDLPERAN
jgi:hypothetical protein